MKTFIEDYLQNPASAIAMAKETIKGNWFDCIAEDVIYAQISSPEFRLYQEMVFCPSEEESPRQSAYSTVA